MNEGALTPVLQLVHYSDIHLAGGRFVDQRREAAGQDPLQGEGQSAVQGLQAANLDALNHFKEALEEIVTGDGPWSDRPIWLVDTGDGTTFGDSQSLAAWFHEWTPSFIRSAGPRAAHVMLHGNHDAWPGAAPWSNPRGLAAQRDLLRREWFPHTWPTLPLRFEPQSAAGAAVELYLANTVDHRLWPSLLSRGLAGPDRRWETPPPMRGPMPVDDLERVAAAQPGDGRPVLRILATHYPVADAAVGAGSGEGICRLANRKAFADNLASPRRLGQPLLQVLLSGHTHRPFPSIGGMPSSMAKLKQPPLQPGTLQLVTASLSQIVIKSRKPLRWASDAEEFHGKYHHQFTLLRLFQNQAVSSRMVLERTIYGRQDTGRFEKIRLSPTSEVVAERITLDCPAPCPTA